MDLFCISNVVTWIYACDKIAQNSTHTQMNAYKTAEIWISIVDYGCKKYYSYVRCDSWGKKEYHYTSIIS